VGLQGFEIQPYGWDRRLEFMRNGVDEGVILLIARDLAHQKKRVEHYAAEDNGEQEDT